MVKISMKVGNEMEILIDTMKDTYLMIPILFIMYLYLEFIEHKNENKKFDKYLSQYGPFLGAILGIIPQCGFGVVAGLLFIENKITLGTLISVFIATSDEAIPLFLTQPAMYSSLLYLILIKLVIAMIAGYIIDLIFKKEYYNHTHEQFNHSHEHSIFIEAISRTLKIYSFIFIVHFGLSLIIENLGPDRLSLILMNDSILQPIISSLFGFIPNCASSVILTQLYMNQALSFASLLAGLITNAGVGILALVQNKVKPQVILKICLILFTIALLVCLPLQWFHLL